MTLYFLVENLNAHVNATTTGIRGNRLTIGIVQMVRERSN